MQRLVLFTFPPWGPRTANEKSVEDFLFPSSLNCVNAAACPSIGWETLRSIEYNCIRPTTRPSCAWIPKNPQTND